MSLNGNNHGACPGYIIDHIQALACGGANITLEKEEDASLIQPVAKRNMLSILIVDFNPDSTR